MDVEMLDGLAAVFSGVDHQAVTLDQALLAGNFGGCPQQVSEQRGIRFIGVVHRGDVFSRYHQNMDGRLGVKVGEGVAELVLVDRLRGDASVNDLAK
jgi:hypothetical protein